MSPPNNSGKRSLLGSSSSWEDAKDSLKKLNSDAETQDKQRREREKKLKNEQESRAASIPELKSPRKVQAYSYFYTSTCFQSKLIFLS